MRRFVDGLTLARIVKRSSAHMQRTLLGSLLVGSVIVVSCALPSPEEARGPRSVPASATSTAVAEPVDLGELDEPAAVTTTDDDVPESPDVFVPTETFPTIDALCAAQKALIAPRIAEAVTSYAERGEEAKLSPSCAVSKSALAGVPIKLKAPFLDVTAIVIETGFATETHIAVRTDDGWRAIPRPAVAEYHDDPGCFSIQRDVGIVAVRVEDKGTPTLFVVERAARGAQMEEPEGPDERGIWRSVSWDDVTDSAVACRWTERAIDCDAPAVVRVERTPSTNEGGRRAKLRFSIEASVDANGHLSVKEDASQVLGDEP